MALFIPGKVTQIAWYANQAKFSDVKKLSIFNIEISPGWAASEPSKMKRANPAAEENPRSNLPALKASIHVISQKSGRVKFIIPVNIGFFAGSVATLAGIAKISRLAIGDLGKLMLI